MLRWKLFRLLQVVLAFLLFLNAGPRQIIETSQKTAVPVSANAAQPHQFDALLRELQTAVSHPSPQLGHIQQLQQQLITEHDSVLAQFQQQADLLAELHVPDEIVARTETAITTYQTHYATLMHLLDNEDVAAVAAFLDETLPATAVPTIPKRTLPQIDTPTRTAVEASTARFRPGKTLSAPTDDPPNADDLAETIEIQFTPDITQLATNLNHNPIEIYNWVHNNIAFTPVWGSIQGAQHCLETRTCNAFDTSSLLAALLRVSGIPTRYQMGSIDVPIDEFLNWAGGFSSPEAAASLFASAGVPDVVRRVNGGNVVSVRLQHIWIKAYVDYVPSRGVVYIEGDTWIELDAAFKQYSFPNPLDFNAFHGVTNAQTFFDNATATAIITETTGEISGLDRDYVLASTTPDEDGVYDFVLNNYPEKSLLDLIGYPVVVSATMPILPMQPSYSILWRGSLFADIPDTFRHQVEIAVVTTSGQSTLSFNRTLPELAGSRLLLTYVPATQADRLTLESLFPTDPDDPSVPVIPAGLINMRAEMQVDGQTAVTSANAPIGDPRQLRLTFTAPTIQTPIIVNDIQVGESFGLALDLQQISMATMDAVQVELMATADFISNTTDLSSLDLADMQGLLLNGMAQSWFNQVDVMSLMAAQASDVVSWRYPSMGMAFYDLVPNTLFGTPSQLQIGDIKMDIDRDVVVTLPKDGNQQTAVHHTLITGLLGSQIESNLPRQFTYNMDSAIHWLSTTAAMGYAQTVSDTLVLITPDNLPLVQANLNLSATDLADIQDDLNAGLYVMLHEAALANENEGRLFNGYISLDPLTGSAAFLISSLNGSDPTKCGQGPGTKDVITSMVKSGLYGAGSEALTAMLSEVPGGRANLVGTILKIVNIMGTINTTLEKMGDQAGFITDDIRPMMGMIVMFAALDILKELLPSSAAGVAAGAYLSLTASVAYEGAAQIIGRMAELDAASQGIILEPGCLARQISTRS